MTKTKLLINLTTVGKEGIPIAWLLKFKALQLLGCDGYAFGGSFIVKLDFEKKDIYKFNESIEDFSKLPSNTCSRIYFIFHSIKRNLKAFFMVRKILKDNFDVIYSPSSVLDLVMLPFLIKLVSKRITWVSVFDNTVPFTGTGNKIIRFLAWLFFRISLILLKRCDKIFVISAELKGYLLSRGFLENQLVLTTNGIENNLIEQAKASDKYNIDALFVGRINEAKGIYDMLEILKIVKNKFPNFQLAIMGEGDKIITDQFKEAVFRNNLEKNIQLLGFKKGLEKFSIMKSARSFWFFSEAESFGISLMEAVCCGVPAFAYDLDTFSKIYKNNEVFMFKKQDYEAISNRVIDLFDKKEFENKSGKLLLGKYSWENIAMTEYKAIAKKYEF